MKIGACFIAGIMLVSLVSRLRRAFELRVTEVRLDPLAALFVRDTARREITLIANEPDSRDESEYRSKIKQVMQGPPPALGPGRHLRRGHRHRRLGLRDRAGRAR